MYMKTLKTIAVFVTTKVAMTFTSIYMRLLRAVFTTLPIICPIRPMPNLIFSHFLWRQLYATSFWFLTFSIFWSKTGLPLLRVVGVKTPVVSLIRTSAIYNLKSRSGIYDSMPFCWFRRRNNNQLFTHTKSSIWKKMRLL